MRKKVIFLICSLLLSSCSYSFDFSFPFFGQSESSESQDNLDSISISNNTVNSESQLESSINSSKIESSVACSSANDIESSPFIESETPSISEDKTYKTINIDFSNDRNEDSTYEISEEDLSNYFDFSLNNINIEDYGKLFYGKNSLKIGSSNDPSYLHLSFQDSIVSSIRIKAYAKENDERFIINWNEIRISKYIDEYEFLDVNTNDLVIRTEKGNVIYLVSMEITLKVDENEHNHVFSNSYYSDETGHWYECSCNQKEGFDNHHPTDWIIDYEATNTSNGKKHKQCIECGYIIQEEIIPSQVEINYFEIVLDSKYSNEINNKYSTGNYGQTMISNNKYEYYRTCAASENDFVTLLNGYDETFLGGSFANYNPIQGIGYLTITYKTNSDAKLYFGNDKLYKNEYIIPASEDYVIKEFDLRIDDTNYFMIETGNESLTIQNITIKYSTNSTLNNYNFLSSGKDLYRINPNTYKDTLVSGKSSISMPIETIREGKKYKVIKSKTYIYYSYDAIMNDNSLAELATYTSPIDVANYYIAFNTWPCNYYPYTSNIKDTAGSFALYQAQDIFKENFRYVSYYTRTNGYVNYVPYATGKNGYPNYYELDIDIDKTYYKENESYSRGVGRLVVFADGFDAEGYDSSPVAVFTDDHYDTFQEYYNNGLFSHRFNASYGSNPSHRSKYTYGTPETLSL